jgi:hypothetical protein
MRRHVVIASNRRDRTVFDLYRVNLTTREATLIAENPGDVTDWLTDREGHEGHRRTYGNWRNVIRHYREVEVFLGACLGGRAGPPPAD